MDKHIPVMLDEVKRFLQVKNDQKYIDATVGAGGYTEAILIQGGEVLGIDQDPKSLEIAQKRLNACPGVFKLIRGNFSNLTKIASENGFSQVSGIVFDLGFASFQVDEATYGLSFQRVGPLDMRLDPDLAVNAADLINALSKSQLTELFFKYGEEPKAKAIAQAIVKSRQVAPIKTTTQLVEIIQGIYGNRKTKINPATKVFQALRIAVNSELDNLNLVLPQALTLLNKGGRLVIVSFHSGEDRIVKNYFKEQEELGKIKVITEKPIGPTVIEIENNPRARSAKLRVIEKI